MQCLRITFLGLILFGTVFSLVALAAGDEEQAKIDADLLKEHSIQTSGEGLLNFLRSRTLSEDDHQKIKLLVSQLGSTNYLERRNASRQLTKLGPPALTALRDALEHPDLEVRRRAKLCIEEIERGPGPELPASAIRLIAHLQPEQALSVLLDYFPFADDEYVQNEVLSALGILGIRKGEVDPLLTESLKSAQAERRAAAAFVLARSGGEDQREVVRQMLEDSDAKVRRFTVKGLLGERAFLASAEEIAADEKLLKEAEISHDGDGLLDYLRRHTLNDAQRKRLEDFIQQLGAGKYKEREQAVAELVASGPIALSFLREASQSSDIEVRTRARECLEKIEAGPGPMLSAAVVRLLADRDPKDAVPVLLAYLPFANDDMVMDEALTTLCFLNTRQAKVSPDLIAAVKDPAPLRRAASAYVLGLLGEPEQCALVRPLLKDDDAMVRYRAAHALLYAKEKDAVGVLAELLAEAPKDLYWEVEDLLRRVAGARSPDLQINPDNEQERLNARNVWVQWWRDNRQTVELTRLDHTASLRGLTIVAELDSNKVWEYGRDGKARWEITNANGPIDAHVLPNGHVLVAEHGAQQVTERDTRGKVHWTYQTPNQHPVACQRLPNGNIFIATYNSVMEVNREGKEIYNVRPQMKNGQVFSIYGAHRMRNGHVVCAGALNQLVELNEKGEEVRSIPIPNNGGWSSVEGLRNGRYLVALTNTNKVIEVDVSGKVHWEAEVSSPAHAQRLPNGRTLVACMNHRKIVEIDQSGKVVEEVTVQGRPFHAHRR